MKQRFALFIVMLIIMAWCVPAMACHDCMPYVVIPGDVDGDFEVTIRDAQLVCSYLVGEVELTLSEQAVSDMNHNGMVDVGDVISIINLINK